METRNAGVDVNITTDFTTNNDTTKNNTNLNIQVVGPNGEEFVEHVTAKDLEQLMDVLYSQLSQKFPTIFCVEICLKVFMKLAN